MEPVLTHRAKTVVDAARLHRAGERRARGLTLVEGPDLVHDVLAAGTKFARVFEGPADSVLELDPAIPRHTVDERAMARLAGTKTPRGPVAVVEIPVEWLDRERDVLVAVGVSDPGNVGTMVRTAAAFGWGFAYLPGTADPWSPKTIRAGAGGQFQTPVARIGSTAELAEWTVVATTVRGGANIDSVGGGRVAVLIGEEAGGLDVAVVEAADLVVTIPTPGATESLNAAVAAGIVVYALSTRSEQTGPPV